MRSSRWLTVSLSGCFIAGVVVACAVHIGDLVVPLDAGPKDTGQEVAAEAAIQWCDGDMSCTVPGAPRCSAGHQCVALCGALDASCGGSEPCCVNLGCDYACIPCHVPGAACSRGGQCCSG